MKIMSICLVHHYHHPHRGVRSQCIHNTAPGILGTEYVVIVIQNLFIILLGKLFMYYDARLHRLGFVLCLANCLRNVTMTPKLFLKKWIPADT